MKIKKHTVSILSYTVLSIMAGFDSYFVDSLNGSENSAGDSDNAAAVDTRADYVRKFWKVVDRVSFWNLF